MALVDVEVEASGYVASVALNRPEQRNGADSCAGADVGELEAARTGPEAVDFGDAFDEALRAVATHPVPVLARVHCAALGAGCQLVVACDLAVAADLDMMAAQALASEDLAEGLPAFGECRRPQFRGR